METLSWIGQKFLPSCCFCRLTPVAYTASLALDCGFFAMGLHHSVIFFFFFFSIGLKTLQILDLDSYKKGGVRQERMGCVENATSIFWRAFFFYQHFAIYGPGDWAAADGGLMQGVPFFRRVARGFRLADENGLEKGWVGLRLMTGLFCCRFDGVM
jgi:hypothetical protein